MVPRPPSAQLRAAARLVTSPSSSQPSAHAGPSFRPYHSSPRLSAAATTTQDAQVAQTIAETTDTIAVPTSSSKGSPVKSRRSRKVHPLIAQLQSEIYATGKEPNPDAVWAAYYDLFRPDAIREGLPVEIKMTTHEQVLRSVHPGWGHLRKLAREAKKAKVATYQDGEQTSEWDRDSLRTLVTKRINTSISNPKTSYRRSMPQKYVDRVLFILDRMREIRIRDASQDHLNSEKPSISNYNHILAHAAEASNTTLVDLVWRHINELDVEPNSETYLSTIKATSRSIAAMAVSSWSARPRKSGSSDSEHEQVARKSGSSDSEHEQVASASRIAAARVFDLLQDMSRRGMSPDGAMLADMLELLRVGGHFKSFQLLVKDGYNIDLTVPGAHLSDPTTAGKPRLSTKALNTVLRALGEHKKVSDMLAVFEVITRPPRPLKAAEIPFGTVEADDPPRSEPPGARSSFKNYVSDLLYIDPTALSADGISQPGKGAVEASEPKILVQGVEPNNSTFRTVIENCCGLAEGSRVAEDEAWARKKGHYRLVARYLLIDTMDRYRLSIQQMITSLGLSEDERLELKPASDAVPFSPKYDTPSLWPTVQHFAPIFAMASHRRDRGTLVWLEERLQETKSLMVKEDQVLRFALRLWSERKTTAPYERLGLQSLCEALMQRADLVARDSMFLSTWAEGRLAERAAALLDRQERRLMKREQKAALAKLQQGKDNQAEQLQPRQVRAKQNEDHSAMSSVTPAAEVSNALSHSQYLSLATASSRAIHTCAGSVSGRSFRPSLLRRIVPVHPLLRATFATSVKATPATLSPPEHADAVIVGGGVAGLALACSLMSSEQLASNSSITGSRLKVILLEASDMNRLRTWAAGREAPLTRSREGLMTDGIDWENRVVSLTMENWTWLQNIGVTDYLVHHRIQPITSMHVSDGLSGAALDLGHNAGMANTGPSESPLSRMIELSNLQQAMLRYLQNHASSEVSVEIRDQTKVETIVPSDASTFPHSAEASQHIDAWPEVHTFSPSGTKSIRPCLLIGADGGSSPVRTYAGIDKFGWGYGCKGLVGTLSFDEGESLRRGDQVAFQRFLPTGTIAWLPLSASSASMVWALPTELAGVMTTLHRSTPEGQSSVLSDLISAAWRLPWASLSYIFSLIASPKVSPEHLDVSLLRREIKGRLQASSEAGTLVSEEEVPAPVIQVASRSVASFPLQVSHADAYLGSSLISTSSPSNSFLPANLLHSVLSMAGLGGQSNVHEARGRTALVGDAAHSIHPLAGQGLNLGLRDARILTDVLGRSASLGSDWGSHDALKDYERQTYLHNQMVLSAVDHLHWLYAGTPIPSGMDYQVDGATGQGGGGQQPFARRIAKDALGRGIVWARSTGLEVLNELDWVKAKMQGFAGSGSGSGSGSAKRDSPSSSSSS